MFLLRGLFWSAFFLGLNGFFVALIFVATLYAKLPPLDDILDYRPRLPMRIFSAEGALIGEFGEERRSVIAYDAFPPDLINALLATEDTRFYEHFGLDFVGLARAAFGYAVGRREGASTITMQVARNFYLRRDRTPLRKIVEILLALKIEREFSKREILERYMNQIYLGHGSYGYAAAAREYYDKPLDELNTAEIAVLAGLPKSPSGANPRSFPARAKERQKHVLQRMRDIDLLDEKTHLELTNADLPPLASSARRLRGAADYAAEHVRKLIFEYFGEAAYDRGFRIYTTVQSRLQQAAAAALRAGLLAHEERHPYTGPEKYLDTRGFSAADFTAALKGESVIGGLRPALVVNASAKELEVIGKGGGHYKITGKRLAHIKKHLPGGKKPLLRAGALVRLAGDGDGDGGDDSEEKVRVVSLPGAQAALVALASDDGAVLAMVGGFDFAQNQFNNVTQARRQPGSALKPFLYSAALEKGVMPATILPDTPIFLSAEETGSNDSWQPKNYDGKYTGPITMRQALTKSKNLASIHLVKEINAVYARDYLLRFGFRARDHGPYLSLALGAGAATPLEMASGYAVFSNGGYYVHPYLIVRVEDYDGNIIVNELDYRARKVVIAPRNAYIMTSLLQSVIEEGTGGAARKIGRADIGGKTGTTNDTRDAWFAGFGGDITAVAWVGYSQPKSLGKKETGARAALPIWIDFMTAALLRRPEVSYTMPGGVIAVDVGRQSGKLLPPNSAETPRREYFYTEYLPAAAPPPPSAEELEGLL